MKRLINILSITSLIAVLLLVVLDISWSDKNQKMSFIFLWSSVILFALAIPLVFGWFSLAVNKDKLSPKVWLTIYTIAVLVYVVIAISFGFIGMTKDLPLVVSEEFSQTSGSVQIIKSNEAAQTIEVKGIQFELKKDTFSMVSANEEYTFVYLPYSKYLIDIIGEDGNSLIIYKQK